MNPRQIKSISTLGIILALFLCTWYLLKTWNMGNPRWYFLVMGMGIALLLTFNLFSSKRRK